MAQPSIAARKSAMRALESHVGPNIAGWPANPRNRDRSIDLNSFDPRLAPDTELRLANEAKVRKMLVDSGNSDLLAMLGLDEVTA